jgi:GNAT superfamily N-acetyltransferase
MWLAEPTDHRSSPGARSAPPSRSARPVFGTITLGMRGPANSPQPVVHWLLVAGAWRRQGVGRLLLGAVERECWGRGFRQLNVQTLSSWTEAVAFYQAMGFART